MAKRMGLGKGLDALFIDSNEDSTIAAGTQSVKISQIEPNKDQPRSDFDDEALRELADSIRVHGIIQPLVVRPISGGGYQIVAGERRWRAARMAGLTEAPVIIRELDDLQTLEVAIIENLQREDLNTVELARGYKLLMEQYGMTQEQVAEKVGKSRPVIANTIRVLALPEAVLEHIRSGRISAGHAKALVSLEDPQLISEIAEKVLQDKILVRDIEKLAKSRKERKEVDSAKQSPKPVKESDSAWGDSFYREMEIALNNELGRKVTITGQGEKFTISMEFYSKDDLAEIASRLTGSGK